MPNDKTRSGLMIVPHILFMDPKDLDEYVAPIAPRPIGRRLHHGQYDDDEYDEGHDGYDPLENYQDAFFDYPCDISFNFFDPQKSLKEPDARGMREYERSATDELINFEGTQEFGVIHGSLGFIESAPNTASFIEAGFSKLSPDQMNTLFTDLTRKAAGNIASGAVKKEDLVDLINRDNGVNDNPNLTYVTPHGASSGSASITAAKSKKEAGLPKKIVDFISGFHENPGATFDTVVDQFIPRYATPSEKGVVGTSILSTIVHGIGDDEFLGVFLDSFKGLGKDMAKQVNNFLGAHFPLDNKLVGRIQRALPITSPYHSKLVKNHYTNSCE